MSYAHAADLMKYQLLIDILPAAGRIYELDNNFFCFLKEILQFRISKEIYL